MIRRKAIPLALLALAGVAAGAPIAADAAVSDAVIIALNSIEIERQSEVTGDVVVNQTDEAPNHGPSGADLQVDKDSTIDGDLYAETVALGRGASTGTVFDGTDYMPPILEPLPAFRSASFDDGQAKPDVFVDDGEIETLAAGQYGTVTIAQNGTLELSGSYDVEAVETATTAGGQCPHPCRTIRFSGATQLRVAGRFDVGTFASIEAAAGSFGRDLVAYIDGANADPADPNSRPAAAAIGRGSTVAGNFYVPGGTFHLERQSTLTGSIIAFDAAIDREATLHLDSAFNLAPTADGQTVETLGVAPIVITLTGSDPDGDALTFTIVAGPSAGAITAGPTPVSPTSATVTYDAAVEGAADQFVFRVDDGKGGSDNAVVDINPSDDPPDPPALDGILAKDDEAEVIQGAIDVPLTLVAAAPVAPEPNPIGDLTFAITSAPDQGGSVSTPVSTTEVPVRSATVDYTPLAGFTGIETFGFRACEVALPTNCDQGTFTIDVQAATPPAPPVAVPQSVSTSQAVQVDINLAVPLGGSGPSNQGGRDSLCGNGDVDAGEQCDDGNLLNGDGCDDQCMDEGQ